MKSKPAAALPGNTHTNPPNTSRSALDNQSNREQIPAKKSAPLTSTEKDGSNSVGKSSLECSQNSNETTKQAKANRNIPCEGASQQTNETETDTKVSLQALKNIVDVYLCSYSLMQIVSKLKPKRHKNWNALVGTRRSPRGNKI